MMAIQLIACIGMTVGFFVLLDITPSDFTEGVFRQITSKPRSLRDEINESTQRKKKSILRREITHVDTADSNNWLNIYAEYDLEARQVCDTLSVILYSEGGGDYKMEYHLKPEEKNAVLEKMEQYCMTKYGQTLQEFAAEVEANITAIDAPRM